MDATQYDPEWVAGYYDDLGLDEWRRLVATPLDEISLHIHTHYLRSYVPSGSRVLEIGAGAGRFTQVLAELEASILVADISPVQLALNRQHAREYGFAQSVEDWQLADICDLSRFAAGSFDCVVAYGGPLSYVLEQCETALRECIRLLRTGGVFLSSVMSLWGTGHAFLESVITIPVEYNRKIVASGDQLPTTFPGARHYIHLFRVEEFRDLLSKTGLTVVALSASNCLSTRWQDLLQTIRNDEEKWNELLRLEVEACAQEGCQGMGTHLIGIGQKI